MDIFSHGLWAGALAKGINNKLEKSKGSAPGLLSYWKAFLWGVFPDLFAFTIPFIWGIYELATGQLRFSDFRPPDASEPPPLDSSWVLKLAHFLYNFSHSIVVFAAVVLLLWFLTRKFFWEMSGWLLHIIMDIPTHSYRFFPTPFLYPISGFKFDGYSWAHPLFLIVDYSALVIIYLYLWRGKLFKKN